MTYKVAYSVKDTSDDSSGYSEVFMCCPPYLGESYVRVSATTNLDLHDKPENETYIFPSNKKGEVTSWTELPGSARGIFDPERVLENIGYDICD
tara:strand:- start:217 stop:498 length:282 start_codon:yes stop_codon:yes gene_type:complete